MLAKISENPEARAILTNLLGSTSGGNPSSEAPVSAMPDGADAAPSEDAGGAAPVAAFSMPPPPPSHGRNKGRREVLLAIRPYLGARRCASVDRMIRALELYEIIEETQLLKGGK
jgi:hypothetical protein